MTYNYEDLKKREKELKKAVEQFEPEKIHDLTEMTSAPRGIIEIAIKRTEEVTQLERWQVIDVLSTFWLTVNHQQKLKGE